MMNRYTLAAAVLALAAGYTAAHISKPSATEARLIGECNGRILAAMEAESFAGKGCRWIEPIRYADEESNR